MNTKKKILYISILLFILIFSFVAVNKFNNFGYRNDLGFFEQIIWNTLHGNFYYHVESLNQTYFSNHNIPFLLLVLSVYYLFQSPLTLIFLTIIFMGLTAIPIYLIAKKVLNNEIVGIVFALGFLLSPLVWNLALFDFYPIYFSLFLFAWMFLFLIKEDWTKFYIALFFLLMIKETMSIVVMLLGLYIIFKHNKKHGLRVLLIGILFCILSFNIIIPYASGPQTNNYMFFEIRYSYLGNTPLEIGKTMITDPKKTLTHTPLKEKISYLVFLGRQQGFLGFLSPEILFIGLSGFLQNVLANDTIFFRHYLTFIEDFHHSALLVIIFFIASIYGFKRFIHFFKLEKKIMYLLFILAVLFIFTAVNDGIIPLHKQTWNKDKIKNYNEIILKIPNNASVVAPLSLYSHLTQRKKTFFLLKESRFYDLTDADVIIIDKNTFFQQRNDYNLFVNKFLDRNYKQTVEIENFIILSKNT